MVRLTVALRLLLCVVTVLTLLCSGPMTVRAATTTWVVTGTFPFPTGCNTTLHRCRTIQAAVSAASSGDYIAVAPGTYGEAVTIDKSLTIVGAGAGLTTIAVPATGGAYGITIADGVSDVALRGLRIAGDANNAIQEGGILIEAPLTGVSNITVTNNVFYGLDNGFGSRGKLSNIRVAENTFDAIQDWTAIEATTLDMGVGLPYAIDGVTISNNEIKNSKTVPIKLSNYSASAGSVMTNLTVSRNRIHNNDGDGNENWMGGIALRHGAANVTIVDNTVQDNANMSGVSITGAGAYDNVTITGNRLQNNSGVDQWPYNPAALAAGVKIVGIAGPTTYRIASNAIIGNARGLEWDGTATLAAGYNWWGSDAGPGAGGNNGVLGHVDAAPFARALATAATGSTHELGETGTLTTSLTVTSVYGMQLRLGHDASIVSWNSGVALDDPEAGWYWDLVQESFLAVTFPDGRRLSGAQRRDIHPAPATLSDSPAAAWTYTCSAAGSSALRYDTSSDGLGSLLSDMDGFEIPAAYLNDSMNCLLSTTAISGVIELQGRTQGRTPNGWDDAVVAFYCVSGACLTSGALVQTFMTGDDGVYVLDKSAPGDGLVPGTYDITAWRHEYLSASQSGVVVGATPLVLTRPRLLGGDANNDGRISIGDLTCIGGAVGKTGSAMGDCGGRGSPEINGHARVSLGDLTITGGNHGQTTSNPWP